MKKIFHFVPTSEANGLETIVMDICKTVEKEEHFFVCPSGPIERKLKKLKINHIPIKKFNLFEIRRLIKKYNPDVVHGHDVKASIYLSICHRICKKRNIKIVSELHNDDERMHRVSLRSLLYAFFSFFVDTIICVSLDVYNNYIFKSTIEHKNKVIENIVMPYLSDDISNIPTSDCIFVGRFEYQKNPEKFVEIIHNIKNDIRDIKCIMIGEGSKKRKIKEMIDEYNLSENISVLDYKDNPYDYIYRSKMMFMPSRYEGFGLVALESMILGTPVVCYDVSGLRRIVDNSNGYISHNDNDAIYQIKKIITDENYLKNKSETSKDSGNELNDIDKFIEKYTQVYESN